MLAGSAVAALFGLSGALLFGAADFLGGLAARRISPLRVTAISAFAGLILLTVAVLVSGGEWSVPAVLWGAVSGVAGALAISLLYASLAIGPMSILSPLTAVVSAIVPMTWGLAGGERLTVIGYGALGLALLAVVLVGFVPEKGAVRPRPRGIVMAIGSGLMIGVFMITIDATPAQSGLIPLVLNRSVNGVLMSATIGVLWWWQHRRRPSIRPVSAPEFSAPEVSAPEVSAPGCTGNAVAARSRIWTPGIRLAVACGLIDATGNTLLLIGMRLGDLSVISVLTAMYPAGTIVLAAVVLRERIAPVQWVGLVLALVAAALLALA
ncbi:MAG: EamA family transporter [Microbacteriaceae bacterium]